MNLLVIVGIILVLLMIAAAVLKAKSGASEGTAKPDVYYVRKSLFTPAERSFAGVLETLNFDGTAIAAKIRLADIFGVKKGLERGDRQRAQNRINAKHVDFLLIQKSDGRPLLGIELDDSSHEEVERVARDAFVDSVFSSAAIPLLHFTAKSAYDPREVRGQIEEALARSG
jgi:hypothetical protein